MHLSDLYWLLFDLIVPDIHINILVYVYQNSKDKCHLQQECCRKNCYNLTKMSFWCFYWYLRILCTLVSKCLKQYLFTFFIFNQTCCFSFTDHHSLTSLSCKKRNNELKMLWNHQSSCLCPRHRRFNVSVEIPFCSLLQLLCSLLLPSLCSWFAFALSS